jgi:hypothetical protein
MNIKPIMEAADSTNENAAIHGLEFWPAERVHEIFARLSEARKTPGEAAELRIFADRMEWLYKNQSKEDVYWPDEEELIHWAAYGEAAEDAERTAKLEAESGNV